MKVNMLAITDPDSCRNPHDNASLIGYVSSDVNA